MLCSCVSAEDPQPHPQNDRLFADFCEGRLCSGPAFLAECRNSAPDRRVGEGGGGADVSAVRVELHRPRAIRCEGAGTDSSVCGPTEELVLLLFECAD